MHYVKIAVYNKVMRNEEKMHYLLNLFDEHQPRRLRVIENVLKSRRTVSNLFWAQQYGLLKWLGAYRTLTRTHYDDELSQMQQAGWLTIQEQQVRLTSAGVIAQEELRTTCYHPAFLDWYWLANTKMVEERFLLGVQVVSELSYHHQRYLPISNSVSELAFIKQWLRRWPGSIGELSHQLFCELLTVGQALASEDPRAANLLVDLLPGNLNSGMSMELICHSLKVDLDQAMLIKHDALLAVAAYAHNTNGVLHSLLTDLLCSSPLSNTVLQSLTMLQRGLTIPEISQRRHLKANTIREHLLEAAIIAPQSLDWLTLIPLPNQAELKQRYQGEPAQWSYLGPDHDPIAFFYYRLWQIIQGETHHDQ